MNWRVIIAAGLCIGLIVVNLPTEASEGRPAVVELFTSQGCSSCPPADQLLAELAQRSGLIALGFHIDYWDGLGWKDPLSTSEGTARQRSYARLLGGGQVCTPQIIVDGTREMIGSRRGEVLAALHETRPRANRSGDIRRRSAIGYDRPRGHAGRNGHNTLGPVCQRAEDTNRRWRECEPHGAGCQWCRGSADAWSLAGGEVRFSIDLPSADHNIAVLVQAADGRMLGAAAL